MKWSAAHNLHSTSAPLYTCRLQHSHCVRANAINTIFSNLARTGRRWRQLNYVCDRANARARIMEMYSVLWQTLNCARIHVRHALLRISARLAAMQVRIRLVLGRLTHETLKKGKTYVLAHKRVLFTRNANQIGRFDLYRFFGWFLDMSFDHFSCVLHWHFNYNRLRVHHAIRIHIKSPWIDFAYQMKSYSMRRRTLSTSYRQVLEIRSWMFTLILYLVSSLESKRHPKRMALNDIVTECSGRVQSKYQTYNYMIKNHQRNVNVEIATAPEGEGVKEWERHWAHSKLTCNT